MEEEHLRTIHVAAMQSRIEKLKEKLADERGANKQTQQTESRENTKNLPHDLKEETYTPVVDDTSDEEGSDDTDEREENEQTKPKKTRRTITGLNLEGIHNRYEGVLKILKKKRWSIAQAMRDFGVPRNTLRDYIGMCELKIIDMEKYQSVVQQERRTKGKAPVRSIELRCREALSGYRAQSNKFKEEGKLLPFYPKEGFYSGK